MRASIFGAIFTLWATGFMIMMAVSLEGMGLSGKQSFGLSVLWPMILPILVARWAWDAIKEI